MAIYRFSALYDGQAIRFNPQFDNLFFDQSAISAADLRLSAEGAHTRVKVTSGAYTGKDILLLNVVPQQLATSNASFADGSRLVVGDDSPARSADDAANFLLGGRARDHLAGYGGNDTLDGGEGADYLNGGAGNDTYYVTSGDVLVDEGGVDTVVATTSWNLSAGFENLTLAGAATSGGGNSAANVIIGNAANNVLSGREGNDSLYGGAGDDVFNMSLGHGSSYGQDSIEGGDGSDTVDFGANARSPVNADLSHGALSGGGRAGAGSARLVDIENLVGGAYDDRLVGSFEDNFLFGYSGHDWLDGDAGRDRLEGAAGNDTLSGGPGDDVLDGGPGDDWLQGGYSFATAGQATGNDTLTGGTGRDSFVFRDNPNPFISSAIATADAVSDFASGIDTLVFDDNVFPSVGAPGRFAAGDDRFCAAPGISNGRDAEDRVVYDTASGKLYYDPDGNGAAASQLIATLQGAPPLVATDIAVI